MEIILNDEKVKLKADISLADLIANYNLSSNQVAIELNRKIVAEEEFSNVRLKAGDKVELIEFVGGG
jgi:sulfur carrier protein